MNKSSSPNLLRFVFIEIFIANLATSVQTTTASSIHETILITLPRLPIEIVVRLSTSRSAMTPISKNNKVRKISSREEDFHHLRFATDQLANNNSSRSRVLAPSLNSSLGKRRLKGNYPPPMISHDRHYGAGPGSRIRPQSLEQM